MMTDDIPIFDELTAKKACFFEEKLRRKCGGSFGVMQKKIMKYYIKLMPVFGKSQWIQGKIKSQTYCLIVVLCEMKCDS